MFPYLPSPVFPGISFTPKEVGEHEVSVRKNGMHVANSPFKIMVGQSEIGEASRVKAFGKGLVEAHTFEMAEFFVDTRNAGKPLELVCFSYMADSQRKYKGNYYFFSFSLLLFSI